MSSGEFDLRMRLRPGEGAFAPEVSCSRAKCDSAATQRLEWRNPRIHEPDRIKIWLACDEHLEFLLGFLSSRDFPLRVLPVDAPVNEDPIA